MKCLGILGGMSWESTALYYRLINEGIKTQLGGLHCANLLIRSVDFQQIEAWQVQGNWQAAEQYLAQCALQLKKAGADGLVIATNTMHKVADGIVAGSSLELLHIADCTGQVLQQRGIKRVGLMATAFTMEQAFYKNRLQENFDVEVVIPDANDRQQVHRIIYEELCLGLIRPDSKNVYIDVVQHLHEQGAEAVILGCTEIGMLLTQAVTDVPLIDTTLVHAQHAVTWMLSNHS